jgi:membrane associated rhomboid family serine protease
MSITELLYLLLLSCLALLSSSLLSRNYNSHLYSFHYPSCSLPSSQHHRILTSAFCHSSYLHLLLDLLFFWDLKLILSLHGIFYFLKYSLFFIFVQKAFLLFSFSLIISYYPQFQPFLHSIHILGSSGLIFSWYGYLLVTLPFSSSVSSTILLWDILPLHIFYLPMFLILCYQIILPRSTNNIGCFSGLLCGFLLGIGLFDVLPNLYWTTCFLLNISILLGKSWYNTMTISGSHHNSTLNRIEIGGSASNLDQQLPLQNGQLIIDQLSSLPFGGRRERDVAHIV